MSCSADLDPVHGVDAEQRLQALQDDGRRAHHFLRPLAACRFDKQHRVFEFHVGDARDGRADCGLPRERHLAVRGGRPAQQFDERTWEAGGEGEHGHH